MKMKKDLQTKLNELKDILDLLHDALKKFEQGDKKYIKTISTILRTLVVESNNYALISKLAEEEEIELKFYSSRDWNKAGSLAESCILALKMSNPISYVMKPPGFTFLYHSVKEWIKAGIYIVDEEILTPERIIKQHASSEGLAHFNPGEIKEITDLKGITHHGNKPFTTELEKIIFQTGIAIYDIGMNLIDRINKKKGE